jgi:adenylate kinase
MDRMATTEQPPSSRPVRLLMLGAPGAGKGTQGVRLAERYQARHVSTGDLLRGQVGEGTELGRRAQPFMDRGDLVPDELILGMVLEDVLGPSSPPSYVLDGFPRTVAQARAAYEQAVASDRVLHAVISLELDHEELVRRLEQRGRESGRPDDDSETVRHRIEEYERKTKPLLGYYLDREILVSIDAVGDPDDVFARIVAAVDAVRGR